MASVRALRRGFPRVMTLMAAMLGPARQLAKQGRPSLGVILHALISGPVRPQPRHQPVLPSQWRTPVQGTTFFMMRDVHDRSRQVL
jgi:hypothetical protein